MKLWKKILIGVVVLAAIVVGLVGYGIFKIGTTYTQKIEPDMRRYVQMTTEEQDRYVIEHMDDFMELLSKKSGDPEDRARLEAMKNDPVLRRASIEWGRAVCAAIIKDVSNIQESLPPQERAKYEREAERLDDCTEKLTALMKKYSDRK